MSTTPADLPTCPECHSTRLATGYGMAGGGMGPYTYCENCLAVVDKVQDPEGKERDG